ncbi:MAG TPA: SIR2 family protein [Nitrospiraceae bacterium]|nr:SIR2 family protein [Nitrospiraceae bacterium]
MVTDSEAPNFNYDQHNLIKMHGSSDRPLTLISTTDDYENYPDTHVALITKVAELLHNNTVLFVGYGLRDEHIRRLLARIRAQRGVWTKKAYAVGFYDTVRAKVLDLRKIQVIHATADEVLPQLATR